MSLGAAGVHLGNTNSDGGNPGGFLATKWIDEAIVTYEQALQLGDKIAKIDFSGQKGDALVLPSLTDRGSPTAKAQDTQVTLVTRTDSEVTLALDKHFEYSFLIEDRTAIQALDSLLREYMQDAGYGLAKKIDQDIWAALGTMQAGTAYSAAVIGGDGETAYVGDGTNNQTALTDAGIRRIIQTLDDSDNPMMDRHLVIPPVERNNLMGLARFTEQAFIGSGDTIRNGTIGNIYGVDVSVSTNCPYVATDADDTIFTFNSAAPGDVSGTDMFGTAYTGSSAATTGRVATMFHKDAVVMASQMDVRLQKQYKQEYLGDLHTADTLYGVVAKREYGGVAIVVPN